mmetsp:Transcript_13015/g.41942  ORF Transcript_13015/g.41942 Transcript_13015/m.41942 type:complete len:314 (+) Transcript_13015:141-1082(+)
MKRTRSKDYGSDSSDNGSGESLMENMEGDYAAIPELDDYDYNLLDSQNYETMEVAARRNAESEIDARLASREDGTLNHLDDFGVEDEVERGRRRVRVQTVRFQDNTKEISTSINLEAMDMSLREWIAQSRTRTEIKQRFRAFLESDKEQIAKIRAMCANNLASFEISYQALSSKVPILAIWVADAPRDIIEQATPFLHLSGSILSCRIFDEVANELVLSSDHFPKYWEIKDEIHVRVRDLPITDTLRDLRQTHLNQLVRVSGVVTRRSTIFPQLRMVKYTCGSCQATLGPFKQSNTAEVVIMFHSIPHPPRCG